MVYNLKWVATICNMFVCFIMCCVYEKKKKRPMHRKIHFKRKEKIKNNSKKLIWLFPYHSKFFKIYYHILILLTDVKRQNTLFFNFWNLISEFKKRYRNFY